MGSDLLWAQNESIVLLDKSCDSPTSEDDVLRGLCAARVPFAKRISNIHSFSLGSIQLSARCNHWVFEINA